MNQNAALFGGAIYADKCTVTLTGTRMDNNLAINGGAILFDNTITATI